jgi:hypothetical protein
MFAELPLIHCGFAALILLSLANCHGIAITQVAVGAGLDSDERNGFIRRRALLLVAGHFLGTGLARTPLMLSW